MEWIELGDLVEIINGYAFKSKNYRDKGVRIVRITNVQKGYIEDSDPKFYSFEDMEDLERFMLVEGDILISLTGNVGRVARVTKDLLPAALNQRVASLKPNEKINDDYLFHMLNSNKFEKACITESNGVAQKNLGTTALSKIEIPVPAIEIQKQIVEVLDEAQKLIDNRKKQIELLDDLIESIFYDMFGDPVRNDKGWKVSILKKYIHSIESGWSPKCYANETPQNKWGVLKLSAVTGGRYDSTENKELPEGIEPRKQYEVKVGDLLITRKNTPQLVGDVCYVFTTQKQLMLPDTIFRINTKDTLNKIFTLYLFKHRVFSTKIKSLASGSAKSMSNISKQKLEELEIPVPPISLQQEFAEKVKLTEDIRELLKRSLNLMEDSYKNLMQKAFRGELFYDR